MGLDFARVASAALASAETLCQEWLGGHRLGNEWLGERRTNGGVGDSWSVNLTTGVYAHFGGDEKGPDLISLYAALNHLSQLQALKAVAGIVGVTNGAADAPKRAKAIQAPPEPIPADAPPLPPHRQHGAHAAAYRYGDAFVIARYEPAGAEKTFSQWTWCDGAWTPRSYPAPRPLYGLPLAAGQPILVVEGEKCQEAACAALADSYAVLTWPGGAGAIKKADWSVLKDLDITLWPDADAPGIKAMTDIAQILYRVASKVTILDTAGHAQGWDIADAIAEGWDRQSLLAWIEERARPVERPAPKAELVPPLTPDLIPGAPPQSALVTVRNLGMVVDSNGRIVLNLLNVSLVLQKYHEFTNRLWYDTFRQTVYHNFSGKERPWDDTENRRLTTVLQKSNLGLEKLTSKLCMEAVYHCAELRARNSVTSWLESLKWDGVSRLAHWLADFFGAPQDEARAAIGTNWLVTMVRRAYEPGCQSDHVVVLEGDSGLGKSSVLEDLSAPWFACLTQKFASKEFNEALRGMWLVEIPDLACFAGREHQAIISGISRRSDVYRVPYDRITSEHPRQCVLCVSTEESGGYLADTFGIRRFWPVPCTEINRGAIRAARDQLFAEALVLYRGGHSGYVVPEALQLEQLERVEKDIYHDKLADWLKTKTHVTNLDIYESIFAQTDNFGRVERPAEPKDQKRITRAMRRCGWIRARQSGERGWRKKP